MTPDIGWGPDRATEQSANLADVLDRHPLPVRGGVLPFGAASSGADDPPETSSLGQSNVDFAPEIVWNERASRIQNDWRPLRRRD